MPAFFSFTQGTETNPRFSTTDASPLLGRFRAVPQPRRRNSLLAAGWRGSVHVGYGALLARELEDSAADDDDDDDGDDGGSDVSDAAAEGRVRYRLSRLGRRTGRRVRDLWLSPKTGTVKRAVDRWWSRWSLLVVLPALLV